MRWTTAHPRLARLRPDRADLGKERPNATASCSDLPERAHRGLETLSEMRALMAAVVQMARDETKAATDQDLQTSLRNVREMTKIAQDEIHSIVLSSARARRQMLAVLPATKPTLH